MKFASIAVLILVLTTTGNATAQKFDISTMTCGAFLQSDKESMKLIVTWLAGFYTEEHDPQVVDLATINDLQDKFSKFCAREASFPMTTAAEGILGH